MSAKPGSQRELAVDAPLALINDIRWRDVTL